MGLKEEAGYLYLYSKELKRVNKKLRSLGKEAHKHASNYAKASEKKRGKYKKKHHQAKLEIKEQMNKHTRLMSKIKHHMLGFNDALRKSSKL